MATKDNNEEKGIQIMLCDMERSGFLLEHSQGTEMENELMAPSFQRVIPTSVVVEQVEREGKMVTERRKIRYIRACPSIYVEDQVKEGYPALNYRTPDNDVIWIKNGKMWVPNLGASKNLYEYLKKYEGNRDNPNRPENAKDIFYEFKPAEVALTSLERRNVEKQARELVDTLYSKTGTKFNFKEKEIDFISNTFGVNENLSYQEKLEAIYALSERAPIEFVKTLERKQNIVEVDVKYAIENNVFDFTGNTIKFAASGEVILESKETKKVGKAQELINFFMLPENKVVYVQLQEAVAEKQTEKMS